MQYIKITMEIGKFCKIHNMSHLLKNHVFDFSKKDEINEEMMIMGVNVIAPSLEAYKEIEKSKQNALKFIAKNIKTLK